MRSRWSLTIALVAVLMLAGCSFLGGGPTTEQQPTFAGNASAVDFPNGTDRTGIVNNSALVNSHIRSLAADDYAIRVVENVSIRGSRINRRRTVRSRLEAQRLLLTIDVPDSPDGGVRYLDNRTVYARTSRNGSTNFSIQRDNAPFPIFHLRQTLQRPLSLLLSFGQFEAVGTVTRANRTLIEYRLTDASLNRRRSPNATVENATGRVLVGQDGVIYDARVDVTGRESGRPFFVDIEYQVRARQNVTVPTPDWLDQARAESANAIARNTTG